MEILEWLREPAYVHREVNNLYFLVVTLIALAVLAYAIKTRNKNAIYLFGFSMIVWPLIEGAVWGMGIRIYDSPSPQMAFTVIAFMEDPGWVCLAYMASEFMFKKLGVEIKHTDANSSMRANENKNEGG